jgi:hypothetical protein
MVNRSVVAVAVVFFSIAVLSFGCKKGCPTCHTFGYVASLGRTWGEVCTNSNCFCPNGYEGDSCQVLSAGKLVNRTYIVSDNCSGSGSYYVTLNANYSNDPSHITVNNIFGTGQSMDFYIISGVNHTATYINILDQVIGSQELVGNGSYQQVSGKAKNYFKP